MGDGNRLFAFGERLVDVPEGTMVCMRRLGQAIDHWPPEDLGPATGAATDAVAKVEAEPAPAPRPMKSLGLRKGFVQSLAKAGLSTVVDVLGYGAEHGSLAGIDGVTADDETAFRAAVEAL